MVRGVLGTGEQRVCAVVHVAPVGDGVTAYAHDVHDNGEQEERTFRVSLVVQIHLVALVRR